MTTEEIKKEINHIIDNLKKQKEAMKQLQQIIQGKPYLEDGKIVRLSKIRRDK